MTWHPKRDDAAERARFIAIYGEDFWNEIQAKIAPKPLAAREVMKPRPQVNDRPALQTEDSDDPRWWEK
jgi:hypothetical protein